MDDSTENPDDANKSGNDGPDISLTTQNQQEPIEAEIVDDASRLPLEPQISGDADESPLPVDLKGTIPVPVSPEFIARHSHPRLEFVETENLAAMGGTVGSIVLGLIALAGAFISSYAALTAIIGIVMGFWGLHSRQRGWAIVGIALCCAALVLAIVWTNPRSQLG